ncbi:heavy metal-binding domain-containing protein [Flavobacterium sp. XGLA_31]|uniref:heavy metal-binding domain-containing protein n=1 Tax=Flavobacterium sp. XGLA_31 TaxID=3447666 RepID=UPI003F36E326
MKKTLFIAAIIGLGMVSCKPNSEETPSEAKQQTQDTISPADSTTESTHAKDKSNTTALYACPMHPEVHGKMNEECPKCGMKLTEPVTKE